MTNQPVLTWRKQAGYGNTIIGFLGKYHVCAIQFRVIRDTLGSYALQFAIPTAADCDDKCSDSIEELKSAAETIISEWISSAGCVTIKWHEDNIGDIISMISRYTTRMEEMKLRITVLELCQHIRAIGEVMKNEDVPGKKS